METPRDNPQSTHLNIMKRIHPVYWILLACLAVVVLLVYFRPHAPVQPAEDIHPRVLFETAAPGTYRPRISLYGRVESPTHTTITATITGQVTQTPHLAGRHVTAGTTLLIIDTTEAALQLSRLDAELDRIRAQRQSAVLARKTNLDALATEQELVELNQEQLQRLERLAKDSLASRLQLDETRQALARARLSLQARQLAVDNYRNEIAGIDAQLKGAQASRDLLALDMAGARVEAPFDGRISELHKAAGERIRPGEPLISLFRTDALEVRAQIPARHLPTVRAALDDGQPMYGEMPGDDRQIPLALVRLAGEVGRGRGGVDAIFSVTGDTTTLELGTATPLTLHLPAVDGLMALPATAIHGRNRIYRINHEATLNQILVEIHGEWLTPEGERRLLLSSPEVSSGDALMITQLPGAIDGLHVMPVPVEDTAIQAPSND